MKKAALANFLKAEKKWNKRSERKIRSSFQTNTTQNTTVLGGKKGKGERKRERKKVKQRENERKKGKK